MSVITVRRLETEDAASFRALRLEARTRDAAAFRGSYAAEIAHPLDWYCERLSEDAVFGAFEGGDLVGMAGFTAGGGSRDGSRGRVWTVYVRGHLRGKHVGEALVSAVIAHARAAVPVLHLSVMAANAPARALYERLGFKLQSIEKDTSPDEQGRLCEEAHYALTFNSSLPSA